ncbi:dTDP-4-dehydrorhamnose 3,5-epimerase family protein [Luteipulveratus halotolerans]|uniref:dTDP-4-dehydrorhamnose 3,5-epimerase n=1 Tax=Luteipulveratus halotolerans TaxID=1631356 RepID=A0A0L6CF83_9MICO|nr:dTDP-4-dehydrorhamnose 3,5-epimerase [Luteipulveratus halotolerans]KNX36364.1 dTDP-4-dehydrorhamnose 3,5-epimerase [Luteipulveratus halotolerans]
MDVRPMTIEGAHVVTPRQFPDERGVFLEAFRGDLLAEHTGHEMRVVQTNVSVSAKGVLRGVHYADVPPSQAKYVTALHGSFLDVVVDLRVGSPTFGRSESVLIDTVDRRAVHLSEGLGHALLSLQDGSVAHYLCSAAYAPDREHGIHPLDPDLALDLPAGLTPVLSPKDAAAPSLQEALDRGLLPRWEDCVTFRRSLS